MYYIILIAVVFTQWSSECMRASWMGPGGDVRYSEVMGSTDRSIRITIIVMYARHIIFLVHSFNHTCLNSVRIATSQVPFAVYHHRYHIYYTNQTKFDIQKNVSLTKLSCSKRHCQCFLYFCSLFFFLCLFLLRVFVENEIKYMRSRRGCYVR